VHFKGSDLSELERKVVFLAELGETSGNPFFHHGVYRGIVKDDMLIFNSSVFLSVDQKKCKDIVKKLQDNGVLLIRPGAEGAISYTNYYYYVTSFTNKEKVLEEIGEKVLETATKSIGENPELIKTLGYALISRYNGSKCVIEEKIKLSPERLGIFIKNCLLFKNRFVYTGISSGINFFVPHAPFFRLLDLLNKKFLSFFFNKLATAEFGIVTNYEELRERILSEPSFEKLGLTPYDNQTIDSIFDLAKSLAISIPIRYLQLYERYRESIISIKVLERMFPLLRGSVETLEDSIQHYKKGTFSDFRLALINIDNTIELILRNHVLKKDNLDKRINFDSLLRKCKDIGVVADNLEQFRQIHNARNQLYHMPVLGAVDNFFIRNALNLAKELFESETNERLTVKI